jgi:hypothetical protein
MNHIHQRVKEWLTLALSFAPCTTQGLLQVLNLHQKLLEGH